MTTEDLDLSEFSPAKNHITVSVGESVRIMRELQSLSLIQLADRTGMPTATLASIENDLLSLSIEQAKMLARALRCHPAVLAFPGWDMEAESAA